MPPTSNSFRVAHNSFSSSFLHLFIHELIALLDFVAKKMLIYFPGTDSYIRQRYN